MDINSGVKDNGNIEIKKNEEKIINNNNILLSKMKENSKINNENKIINNDIMNNKNNINMKGMPYGKESIMLIDDDNYQNVENKRKVSNDFVFGQYIDSDKEIELEKEDKKKRHLKIDLDKNKYFNFLIGGLIKDCQIKKGKNGIIEQYEEKKQDIFKTKLFKAKPIIKKYNKKDIKINEEYKLCENLSEKDILQEDENYEELDDDNIRELGNLLRLSIDKSTNSSINGSIRQSYNQSYAEGIYDSLHGSNLVLSGGKGILGKLKQVFGSTNAIEK
jgi:hypothetical protein